MHKIIRHSIYWICIYWLWLYLKSYGYISWDWGVIIFAYVLIFMFVFYTLKNILIPRFYNKGKTSLFLLGIIVSSFSALGLWVLMMKGIKICIVTKYNMLPTTLGTYLLELVQFYSPSVALLVWDSYEDRIKEQDRIASLEKENLTNELKYLKAQVDPHFLVNTLKSIKQQVVDKNQEAPQMIMQLSGVLDYILYQGQKAKISVEQEIKTIENFITLERSRKTEIKHISLNISGSSSIQISPLILLSLVQHVFKIIDEGTDPESIQIDISYTEQNLKTEISIIGLNEHQITIEKLEDIKRQIEIEYSHDHSLTVEKHTNETILHLTLKNIK